MIKKSVYEKAQELGIKVGADFMKEVERMAELYSFFSRVGVTELHRRQMGEVAVGAAKDVDAISKRLSAVLDDLHDTVNCNPQGPIEAQKNEVLGLMLIERANKLLDRRQETVRDALETLSNCIEQNYMPSKAIH